MTPSETRFLLGRVSRAWGRQPPSVEIIQEWTRGLGAYDVDVAHAALDRMILEGREQGPNLPQLVAGIKAFLPREDTTAPESRRGPFVTPDQGREHIAAIRAQLAARGRKT